MKVLVGCLSEVYGDFGNMSVLMAPLFDEFIRIQATDVKDN